MEKRVIEKGLAAVEESLQESHWDWYSVNGWALELRKIQALAARLGHEGAFARELARLYLKIADKQAERGKTEALGSFGEASVLAARHKFKLDSERSPLEEKMLERMLKNVETDAESSYWRKETKGAFVQALSWARTLKKEEAVRPRLIRAHLIFAKTMMDSGIYQDMNWSLDEAENLARKLDPKPREGFEKEIRELRRLLREAKK
jgi:hypothetical protein